jgi:hypothetical protein
MDEQQPPKVVEHHDLPTHWVTDCVAVGIVGGVVVITLADQRFALGDGRPEEVEKHVVARLAMTPASFNDMVGRARAAGAKVSSARRARARAMN